MQCGFVAMTVSLIAGAGAARVGALLIAGGVVSFVAQVRRMLGRRLPRPPALPRRDWSTWQVHAAFVWLLAAIGSGMVLSFSAPGEDRLDLMWMYGVAGLVGFMAQMVVGMQGRLVPLYAWYRAYAATDAPPARAANALPSAAFARAIFCCWLAAVPLLVWGLPREHHAAIRAGALALLAGLVVGGAYIVWMVRIARRKPQDG